MTKIKKAKWCKNVILTVCFVLAIVAMVMIAFDAVVDIHTGMAYSGHEVTFLRFEDLDDTIVNSIFNPYGDIVRIKWAFSFGSFTAYFLTGVAIVCCIAAIACKKQGLVLSVLTMMLFMVAGVLFLNMVSNLQPYVGGYRRALEAQGYSVEEVYQMVNEYIAAERANYTLGWAPIVSAVCCFVAAGGALMSKISWQLCMKGEEI